MNRSVPNQYRVYLSDEQRQRLSAITRCGTAPARKIQHAQVLLLSDHHRPGGPLTRTQIGDTLGMHANSVDRIRKRFVLDGEAPAIERKVRLTPPIPPKLDGRGEAHLVAICCSPPPEGRTRWTLRLLADEMVKRRIVTSIGSETVRRTLKKTNCSLGASSAGASPSVTQRDSSHRWRTSSTSTPARTRTTSR